MRQTAVKAMIWTLSTGPKVLAAIALVAVLLVALAGCGSTAAAPDEVVPVYGETTWTPEGHKLLCKNEPLFPACQQGAR